MMGLKLPRQGKWSKIVGQRYPLLIKMTRQYSKSTNLDQYNLFSENILSDKLLIRAIFKIGLKAQQSISVVKLGDKDLQKRKLR